MAPRPVRRGAAEVAGIAKASEEAFRGFPTLGWGVFEEGPSPHYSSCWNCDREVADAQGSQRFSFSAQRLKPSWWSWGDECRADCGRGERKALALISLQGFWA